MRQLFILRPEPGAGATAQKARTLGLSPILAPLFEIAPIAWEVPEPDAFDGLLLTSANGVRCAGEQLDRLQALEVYAVGEATAAAARQAGFSIAATGDIGVERLLGSIGPSLKLLHLCGADRQLVDGAPQRIAAVPVYHARPLPRPSELGDLHGAVAAVHSPRAAARLAELVDRNARRSVRIATISDAAAAAAGAGWEKVEAAAAPTEEALLALAARLCKEDGE